MNENYINLKIAEIAKPIPHFHITFDIPKILRAYFRRNLKLLKLLVQSANYDMNTYFEESLCITDGFSGGIYCVQTQGALYNFHPHIHALVPAGILKNGVFTSKKYPSAQVITQLFRARLLKVLIKEGVIQEELVEMLMSWNHNSGFNVHSGGNRISGSNESRIEQVSRYMSRATITARRVDFDPGDQTVTVYEKQEQPFSKTARYSILDFPGLLACQIPSTYESLVYYYGI